MTVAFIATEILSTVEADIPVDCSFHFYQNAVLSNQSVLSL